LHAKSGAPAEQIELALDSGGILGTWVWEIGQDRFIADQRFARTFALDSRVCCEGVPLSVITKSIHADDLARVERAVAEVVRTGGTLRRRIPGAASGERLSLGSGQRSLSFRRLGASGAISRRPYRH
jgi:hypothetical protein